MYVGTALVSQLRQVWEDLVTVRQEYVFTEPLIGAGLENREGGLCSENIMESG